MKIYIHTDLEGISGIGAMEMIDRESPSFKLSAARLIADVNAAAAGAFEGGASFVTVLDSHGGGGNIDPAQLDPRVDFDKKENGLWWGKLDDSYAGTFFIGAHAMAGTMNGFLDHTQNSVRWYNYIVNGRRMGELAQWAMVAAHFKVPLLMVSGDEAACAEARNFFGAVECAAVKRGIGRNRAELMDTEAALTLIRETARKAASLAGRGSLFTPILPMEVRLELCRGDYCDDIARQPGVERIDARTVRKVCNSYLDCLF